MILSEGSSGHYTAGIAGLYPDYFRIQLSSDMNLTAGSLIVSSDGASYEVSALNKMLTIGTSPVALAPLVQNQTTGAWTWVSFADDWNFHTGKYSKVAKMSEVWDNVRTIATDSFPVRGVPIGILVS